MLSDDRIKEAESNVRQYLAEGLLRKQSNETAKEMFIENSDLSLETAQRLLSLETPTYKPHLWVIVSSYYAMYYIANAVLLNIGYKVGDKISHKVVSDALIVFARNKLKKELIEEYEDVKTDAVDSSPTISYTANPSTSNTGTYTTTCTATDDAGNSATSSISYTVSPYGSASSSGSSYTKTIVQDNKEFSEIQKIETSNFSGGGLGVKERIRIKINDEEYYIGVDELTETTVTIEIFSISKKTVFNIGDEKKFEVTDDDYYDIFVKLNSIDNNKANLTIKSIYEQIPKEELDAKKQNTKENKEEFNWGLWFVIGLIMAVLVWFFKFRRTKKRN